MSPQSALGHQPAAPAVTTLFVFSLALALLCFAFWPSEVEAGAGPVERAQQQPAESSPASASLRGSRP